MKKLFISISFLLVSNFVFGQIEWAPVGAKWWVLVQTDFTFQEFINKYECTGILDTLGHTCKVVHESSFDGVERDFYYYQESDKVYFYDAFFEVFVLYFDYSKQAGESYQIIYGQDTVSMNIDSVNFKMFGGESIKVQHGRTINPNVEFSHPYNQIYEGIGTYTGLGPSLPSNLTVEIWFYLACYLKPDGTLYNMNPGLDIDCQALATPVDFINENKPSFTISPNPTPGPATLTFTLPLNTTSTIQILNSLGQKVQEHQLPIASESLLIDGLQPGMYFVVLLSNGQPIKTKKLLRF